MVIERKVSAVFLEYLDPMLQELDYPVPGTKEFDSTIMMGWSVWNSVITKDLEGDESFLNNIKQIPDPFGAIEKLIERKRTLFKDFQYKLGQHEVRKKPDGSYSLFLEARESAAVRTQ